MANIHSNHKVGVSSQLSTSATMSAIMSLLDGSAELPSEVKMLSIHSELLSALSRKRDIEKSLLELEVQLYNYESSFLEKYSSGINLLKGFNATTFISTSVETPIGNTIGTLDDSLRIFSNSSTTSNKAISVFKKISERQVQHSFSSPMSQVSSTMKLSTPKINIQKLSTSSGSIKKNKQGSSSLYKKKGYQSLSTSVKLPRDAEDDEVSESFQVNRKKRKPFLGNQLIHSDDSEIENNVLYEEDDGIVSLFSSSSSEIEHDEDYSENLDEEPHSISVKGRHKKKKIYK